MPAPAAPGTGADAAGRAGLRARVVAKLSCLAPGPLPYTFRDPGWLLQAVTHVSVLGAASYQRLEFLGDALLDLLVSLRLLAAGRL